MPTDEALGHPTILWHCSSIGHSLFVMTAQAKNFPSTRNVILLAIRAESASRPFLNAFKNSRARKRKIPFHTGRNFVVSLFFKKAVASSLYHAVQSKDNAIAEVYLSFAVCTNDNLVSRDG